MATQPLDANGEARMALHAIARDYGAAALANPEFMNGILRDLIPDLPREASVLVAAAEANVAGILRERADQHLSTAAAVAQAVATLEGRTALAPDACHWAACQVAEVLGLPQQAYPVPPLAPTPSKGATGDDQQLAAVQVKEPPAPPQPEPITAPPVAFTGYPVLPGDLQWSSPVVGAAAVERIIVSSGAWVKIGDPLLVLGTAGGQVTLWSTYIGQIGTVGYKDGESLEPDRPVLTLAVSGWLFRAGARMPFDTGVMLMSGAPSKRLDATGTASRLLVTVDNAGSRPVPWRTRCLLFVPVGNHLVSAIYEQLGYGLGTANMSLTIQAGRWSSLTYKPPRRGGGNGQLHF
jgi:hypothetical protein